MFFHNLAKYTDFKPSYLLQETMKSLMVKKLDSISFMNWLLYKAKELCGRVPDENADVSGALRGLLMKVLGFNTASGVQKQYKRLRLFQR